MLSCFSSIVCAGLCMFIGGVSCVVCIVFHVFKKKKGGISDTRVLMIFFCVKRNTVF